MNAERDRDLLNGFALDLAAAVAAVAACCTRPDPADPDLARTTATSRARLDGEVLPRLLVGRVELRHALNTAPEDPALMESR